MAFASESGSDFEKEEAQNRWSGMDNTIYYAVHRTHIMQETSGDQEGFKTALATVAARIQKVRDTGGAKERRPLGRSRRVYTVGPRYSSTNETSGLDCIQLHSARPD